MHQSWARGLGAVAGAAGAAAAHAAAENAAAAYADAALYAGPLGQGLHGPALHHAPRWKRQHRFHQHCSYWWWCCCRAALQHDWAVLGTPAAAVPAPVLEGRSQMSAGVCRQGGWRAVAAPRRAAGHSRRRRHLRLLEWAAARAAAPPRLRADHLWRQQQPAAAEPQVSPAAPMQRRGALLGVWPGIRPPSWLPSLLRLVGLLPLLPAGSSLTASAGPSKDTPPPADCCCRAAKHSAGGAGSSAETISSPPMPSCASVLMWR